MNKEPKKKSVKESPNTFAQAILEEFYTKEGTVVYLHRRLNGQEWQKLATSYYEIPVVVIPPTHSND